MVKTTRITYSRFGAPEVKTKRARGSMKDELVGNINTPATGSVEFSPDELRLLATQIQKSENEPIVKLLFENGDGNPEEFAKGLREAADFIEENN